MQTVTFYAHNECVFHRLKDLTTDCLLLMDSGLQICHEFRMFPDYFKCDHNIASVFYGEGTAGLQKM